jgi:uncharacterized protein YprB with RNaseH-like and TPR domain
VLQNTFLHVPGIARTTEKRLWKEGCECWEDLLASPSKWSLGSANRTSARRHLEKSYEALKNKEHQFFRHGLGMRQAWRAFPEFRDSCAYLDIETDGNAGNSVTMIGIYDGKNYQCLIQGDDLENFRDVISHYSMVITFFGFSYDIPVLEKRFPGLDIDQIHIDLCPMLAQLGMRGGLKKIEKELGIERSSETQGLTGRDAVWLWRKYSAHDDTNALKRLIAYNKEDCVNLERLAEYAYDGLKAKAMEEAGLDLSSGMKSPVGVRAVMPVSYVPQLPGLEELVEV